MYWPLLFLPYGDNVALNDRRPWGTYAIITLCTLVFVAMRAVELQGTSITSPDQLLWLVNQDNKDWLYRSFAFIPSEALNSGAVETGWRMLVSMFMHDSWRHFLLNMTAVWAFGQAVERRMGTRNFVAFYLLAGLFATGIQWWSEPASAAAQVGASGASWAVTAAYLLWFPRAQIRSIALVPVLNIPLPVPAIPVWFFMAGATAVGTFWSLVLRHVEQAADTSHILGSVPPSMVADFAHLGGALFGMAVAAAVILWTKHVHGLWYQHSYRPLPARSRIENAIAIALLIAFSGWALTKHSRMIAAEVQQLQNSKQPSVQLGGDGGFDQDISKGLGDSLAKNFDIEGLKQSFAKANKVLPAFIDTLESHPEILQPFEKACSQFASLSGEFKQSASDEAKNAAALKYFGVANDAMVAFKDLLSGTYGQQLKDYVELEQALGNYFSMEFSKPLLPPSQDEDNARKLLLHAFEHIVVLRDSVQELALLQALETPPAQPGLPANSAVLEARLKQLGDNPVCQPVSH